MFFPLLTCFVFFVVIIGGLAWPLAAHLRLEPGEKVVASITLSLLGVYLVAWIIYVGGLPTALLWMLPGLAVTGLGWKRSALVAALRNTEVRTLLGGQLLVTLWCIGWLALVLSYSGGGWVADWFGHMQRTWFFLEHWPRDILLNGFDTMPSRPPLANLINGAFLELTQQNFRHYQLISTLLASLAFLPAALLARRFGGNRAVPLLAVLFMVNPLFIQNATYAWTKLPAAFFILAALYFFLRAHDRDPPPASGVLFAVCLAAGLLTHYSGGPYALLFALAWVLLGWARRGEIAWWRATGKAALAGGLILATWFGWALMVYGWQGTFLSNTSVTDQAVTAEAQLRVVTLNIRDTLVPHFMRTVDFSMFRQGSSSGWWRDWFFNLYQTNLFLAFGCVAWAAILALLVREGRKTETPARLLWTAFIAATVMLGIAVHGGRDTWGLTHICLQPLVLLGLAFLAARWPALERSWRLALVAGATVDFAVGILLHFGVQSFTIDHWLRPKLTLQELVTYYSIPAQMNFTAKSQNHWVFFGDVFASSAGLVGLFLAALLLFAVFRTNRSPAGSPPRT